MTMQSIELKKAEAQAAQLCLTILTDAGLIGENLVTKLRDAQQAILACLPKMYAACNQVEKETGKNMFRVSEAVVQMFSRAKWADHDAMMTRVEALLVAFVEEVKEEAPAVEEKVEGLAPVACAHTPQLVAMAKDSKAGLEVRITKLSNALNTLSEEDLEQFMIVSPLVAVAYGLIDGRYASHTDLTIAPGFQSRSVALDVCGPDHVVKTRREVLETALMSSKEAHSKLSEFLAKEPVETTTELKPSAAWLAQQERGE
ncbi:hypothetical protein Ahp2_47 [Aeromonas phage Ahp2]|nr:hypothetical protein Ahp2_47 [Aeromonas phage Ahp2]